MPGSKFCSTTVTGRHSTPRAPGTKAQWMYVGEGFVKELDFGRVILRLNEADEGDKDEILGEWKSDIKPFLQQAMDGSSKFQLRNQDDKVVGTVELEARYVPVPVTLEPRESVNSKSFYTFDLYGL